MRYRRLVNGEPQFGQGKQDFLQGVEAVAQAVMTRLSLYIGEWWEDQADGLPLWTKLLTTSGVGNERFNAIISARILETRLGKEKLISGITNVSNVWDSSARRYAYRATAKSIYGHIMISNGGN
jgi:hypothetical protein